MKDCPKNELLAEKRSFEGNCEILHEDNLSIFLWEVLFFILHSYYIACVRFWTKSFQTKRDDDSFMFFRGSNINFDISFGV